MRYNRPRLAATVMHFYQLKVWGRNRKPWFLYVLIIILTFTVTPWCDLCSKVDFKRGLKKGNYFKKKMFNLFISNNRKQLMIPNKKYNSVLLRFPTSLWERSAPIYLNYCIGCEPEWSMPISHSAQIRSSKRWPKHMTILLTFLMEFRFRNTPKME